jgi:hypothetical protein
MEFLVRGAREFNETGVYIAFKEKDTDLVEKFLFFARQGREKVTGGKTVRRGRAVAASPVLAKTQPENVVGMLGAKVGALFQRN